MFAKLLFLLLAGHALCDYPLQGDFLSRGKNAFAPLPGVPWYQCLWAHCMIQAAMVYLITGHLWMGAAEFVIHWFTDYAKCEGKFGIGERAFNIDQFIHVACKILWAGLAVAIY